MSIEEPFLMADQQHYKADFLWGVLIIAGIFVFCVSAATVKAADPAQELIRASMAGDLQKVERLLREGVNVNARFKDGFTALMLASLTNRPAIVTLFLRKGVDVNARTSHGVTALMLASGR
jgi:ankyrin repeat protein